MTRRITRGPRLAAVAGTLAAALALGACGSDDDSSTSTAAATGTGSATSASAEVQDAKLTIGMNSPTYSTQMVTFVAEEKGFFAEEGITDVEVVTSDDYVAGLVSGSLDITQGDTDTLLTAAQKSGDVELIAVYRSKEFQMLAVGEGITKPEDLKGRTVTGGDRGGRNEAVVKQILTKLGLDPNKDVRLVPFGGGSDDRLQALLAGKIQATNLFPRHKVPLEEAGGRFLYSEVVDAPQESVATTPKFLEENRPLVEAYLRATLKARQFIADEGNKDEVIRIMREADFEVPDEYVAVFADEVIQISPDGGFDVAAMDALIDEEKELDLVPADLDWRAHFDLEPLWAAQEALGLKPNPSPEAVQAP
ncbi:MAG: ABC transporter substrate-binding protein [Solirubrobacteraceae bacterium]|nr:ABC transporter substrate-binding protein [Solirubrobacteraceae bacterium]